jgi:nucleotide-binding universal stress UspA family protein
MSEIVVGYDGSDSSKRALEDSLELSKALGDRLVIVFGYAPGGYGGGEVPTQREAVKEFGERVTQEAADAAKAAKVECEIELVNHHPDDALLEAAEKRDARMIVVGSHGESPLKGALLGSTPYRLVHLSERPVLVVRD